MEGIQNPQGTGDLQKRRHENPSQLERLQDKKGIEKSNRQRRIVEIIQKEAQRFHTVLVRRSMRSWKQTKNFQLILKKQK